MLEPQGPLPPEIYWRRRALAAGVVVVVVVVIVGIIVLATGGSDETPTNTSAGLSSVTSVSPPETIDPSQSGVTGGGSGGGSVAAPASGAPGASAPAPSGVPQSSQVPGAVPASGLCPDQNISVVLYTDKPGYTTGDKPIFTIVVTNAGLSECTRDVGKDMQNVTVRSLDGVRYIWSATDCSPINTVNNQLLRPAAQFKDTIVWSGTTSSPGCKLPRVPAGAGPYQAVGALGQRQSAPITFNFVDPPGA